MRTITSRKEATTLTASHNNVVTSSQVLHDNGHGLHISELAARLVPPHLEVYKVVRVTALVDACVVINVLPCHRTQSKIIIIIMIIIFFI